MKLAHSVTRLLTVVVVGCAVLTIAARAQDKTPPKPAPKPDSEPAWAKPPDDRYVKVLAGKKLEEGKGFPGIAVVGESVGPALRALGNGREDFDWPFWHFYDLGPWVLTICVNFEQDVGEYIIKAIIISGDAAPPTSKGLRVGDPLSKVETLYGKPGPLTESLVGLARLGRTVHRWRAGEGSSDWTIQDPPEFADAVWLPSPKLAIVPVSDTIAKIAVIAPDERLPAFVRAEDKVRRNRDVSIDPTITVPTMDPEPAHTVRVPPIPALETTKTDAWTAQTPRGWTHTGDVWKDPDSPESVTVTTLPPQKDQTPEDAVKALLPFLEENLVPEFQRPLTPEFCRMIGATAAYAFECGRADGGKKDFPLGVRGILAMKGDQRYAIIVTRTEHPRHMTLPGGGTKTTTFLGSPDGEAFARAVIRSFRILK